MSAHPDPKLIAIITAVNQRAQAVDNDPNAYFATLDLNAAPLIAALVPLAMPTAQKLEGADHLTILGTLTAAILKGFSFGLEYNRPVSDPRSETAPPPATDGS